LLEEFFRAALCAFDPPRLRGFSAWRAFHGVKIVISLDAPREASCRSATSPPGLDSMRRRVIAQHAADSTAGA
jgi:hypothetical protein